MGIGVAGPGLDGWESARKTLAGETPYVPADANAYCPEILPPVERRRSSATIKWSVQAAHEAATAANVAMGDVASVFASANGDPDIIHQICDALSTEPPMVSPTRFHNSVHNAPAGYWSIATGSRQPATAIAAYDDTFSAGILAAMAQVTSEKLPVLLVVYDRPFPSPLAQARVLGAPFAAAFVLAPQDQPDAYGHVSVAFGHERVPDTILDDPLLEALRLSNPAARALPLLRAIAGGTRAEEVCLTHRGSGRLRLRYTPC